MKSCKFINVNKRNECNKRSKRCLFLRWVSCVWWKLGLTRKGIFRRFLTPPTVDTGKVRVCGGVNSDRRHLSANARTLHRATRHLQNVDRQPLNEPSSSTARNLCTKLNSISTPLATPCEPVENCRRSRGRQELKPKRDALAPLWVRGTSFDLVRRADRDVTIYYFFSTWNFYSRFHQKVYDRFIRLKVLTSSHSILAF